MGELVDLEEFKSRSQAFSNFEYDFDRFWKWKLNVETGEGHILDDSNRGETLQKLSSILRKWQAYRPFDTSNCLRILEDSLERMSEAYAQIKNQSLLEFSEIPKEPLEVIWHELGRAKTDDGNTNPGGYYYVVGVTKAFMILWGQTLAFDGLVRKVMPHFNIGGVKNHVWSFKKWMEVMGSYQAELESNLACVKVFKEESKKKFGNDSVVPYGQFLDLYYWIEGRDQQ